MSVTSKRAFPLFYIYNVDEINFREVYKRINNQSNIDTEEFSTVELNNHHEEIMRLKDLTSILLDEIEAWTVLRNKN